MKKMLRCSVGIAIVAVLVALTRGAEMRDTVAVKALHTFASAVVREGDSGINNQRESKGILSITLLVRNTGNSVLRVATRYRVEYFLTKSDRCVASLLIQPQEVANGVFPVIPESELGIVELRPNEVAWIGWGDRFAAMPNKPIFVRYVVDPKIAARYNLWAGDVEVESHLDVTSSKEQH